MILSRNVVRILAYLSDDFASSSHHLRTLHTAYAFWSLWQYKAILLHVSALWNTAYLITSNEMLNTIQTRNKRRMHLNLSETLPWWSPFLWHAVQLVLSPECISPPSQRFPEGRSLRRRPLPWSGTTTPRGSGRGPHHSSPRSGQTCWCSGSDPLCQTPDEQTANLIVHYNLRGYDWT